MPDARRERKQKIVLAKPPKAVSEMTDEERHDFATRIVDAMWTALKPD